MRSTLFRLEKLRLLLHLILSQAMRNVCVLVFFLMVATHNTHILHMRFNQICHTVYVGKHTYHLFIRFSVKISLCYFACGAHSVQYVYDCDVGVKHREDLYELITLYTFIAFHLYFVWWCTIVQLAKLCVRPETRQKSLTMLVDLIHKCIFYFL